MTKVTRTEIELEDADAVPFWPELATVGEKLSQFLEKEISGAIRTAMNRFMREEMFVSIDFREGRLEICACVEPEVRSYLLLADAFEEMAENICQGNSDGEKALKAKGAEFIELATALAKKNADLWP